MTAVAPPAHLPASLDRLRRHPLWSALRRYWWLWVVPTGLCTFVALAYALIRPDTWRASQALIVRDQASGAGADSRQGRFGSLDAMKTAQETITEVARDQTVVAAALRLVGPPAGKSAEGYPTELNVLALRQAISVSAPNGAEFGQTEVIHLSLTDSNRDRAGRLVETLCNELTRNLQQVRDARASSVVAELEQSLELARADLAEVTARLATMESSVGADLGELRSLNDAAAGDSNLRAALTEIKNEIRQQETAREAAVQLREFLVAARTDPTRLVAAPQRLLDTQPALRRLREGLVESQLRTAELLGSRSPEHPLVIAAQAAQREVITDLTRELETAIAGVDAELAVSDALSVSLQRQMSEVGTRLNNLASLRAEYSNLTAEAQRRNDAVQRIQEALAEARADRTAAQTASLLTRLHGTRLGTYPEGMGRTSIVFGGLFGGLAMGLGLVVLTASPACQRQGRRMSDLLGRGRRATDQPGAAPTTSTSTGSQARRATDTSPRPGRRAEDSRAANPPQPPAPSEPASTERRTGDRRQGERRN